MRVSLLITYDVNTTTKAGVKRLSKIAKTCEAYGQRVQLSVFECSLNAVDVIKFRGKLVGIMDHTQDSLRIYHLSSIRGDSVEAYGIDRWRDLESEVLMA